MTWLVNQYLYFLLHDGDLTLMQRHACSRSCVHIFENQKIFIVFYCISLDPRFAQELEQVGYMLSQQNDIPDLLEFLCTSRVQKNAIEHICMYVHMMWQCHMAKATLGPAIEISKWTLK